MNQIEEIGIADFDKVDVRVGTILSAKPNKRSRNPSYVLRLISAPSWA